MDSIRIITIKAVVQENGILRLPSTGRLIGRLAEDEEVNFNTLSAHNISREVSIGVDQFEHLLNCMCNQKFIHEQSIEGQKEWQEIIDKSYHEARALLSPLQAETAV